MLHNLITFGMLPKLLKLITFGMLHKLIAFGMLHKLSSQLSGGKMRVHISRCEILILSVTRSGSDDVALKLSIRCEVAIIIRGHRFKFRPGDQLS